MVWPVIVSVRHMVTTCSATSSLSAAFFSSAPAAEAGCTLILTEDLQDGSILNGVEIHNPFDPAGGLTARASVLLGL